MLHDHTKNYTAIITSLSVHCLNVGVAFFVAALGESLAQEAEGAAAVQEERDRRLAAPAPLEQAAVDWPAPCCDDTPCERLGHAWRDMTYVNTYIQRICRYN